MKFICLAALLAVFVAGCTSASPLADNRTAQPVAADTNSPNPVHGAKPEDSAPKPPRLSVGTGYPDERLILPWFLNDAIGSINSH